MLGCSTHQRCALAWTLLSPVDSEGTAEGGAEWTGILGANWLLGADADRGWPLPCHLLQGPGSHQEVSRAPRGFHSPHTMGKWTIRAEGQHDCSFRGSVREDNLPA